MKTYDLIKYLRRLVEHGAIITKADKEMLGAAADKLEELDERVAIMAANMDEVWGRNYG